MAMEKAQRAMVHEQVKEEGKASGPERALGV